MANNVKRRAKRIHIVQCAEHGSESDKWAGRMVRVSQPMNKRQRMGGCPICAAQARAKVAA